MCSSRKTTENGKKNKGNTEKIKKKINLKFRKRKF